MNWKDVSISQYQAIQELNPDMERVDHDCFTLSILYGKDFDYYYGLPKKVLEATIKDKLAFTNSSPSGTSNRWFRIGWHWYKVTANKEELLTHQNVTVQKLWAEGGIQNLHKVLACITVKYNIFGFRVRVKKVVDEFEKRSELFKTRLNIETALSRLLFFWLFYMKSSPLILRSLMKDQKQTGKTG